VRGIHFSRFFKEPQRISKKRLSVRFGGKERTRLIEKKRACCRFQRRLSSRSWGGKKKGPYLSGQGITEVACQNYKEKPLLSLSFPKGGRKMVTF